MLIEQPWDIELVEWEDAANWHGSLNMKSDKADLVGSGLVLTRTVGFVVFESDKEIKVAHSHAGSQEHNNEALDYVMCIPRGWIQKRTRLVPAPEVREVVLTQDELERAE